MDTMKHRPHFRPLVGRTPGGANAATVSTDDSLPPLPATATDVVVGVVDTGVVLDHDGKPHPWFHDRLGDDPDADSVTVGDTAVFGRPAQAEGHGTFVSGLILGVASRARVMMRAAVDPIDDIADGEAVGFGADEDARVAEAVRDLAGRPGVEVINLSFGGGRFTEPGVATELEKALREIKDRIAVVAAAGNDGTDAPVWPAAFDWVTAVGAVEGPVAVGGHPDRAAFSNHGEWVDLYADGVEVLGPFVRRIGGHDGFLDPYGWGWARWSGTSFAAARVSGRIAQTAIELRICGAEAAEVVKRDAAATSHRHLVYVR